MMEVLRCWGFLAVLVWKNSLAAVNSTVLENPVFCRLKVVLNHVPLLFSFYLRLLVRNSSIARSRLLFRPLLIFFLCLHKITINKFTLPISILPRHMYLILTSRTHVGPNFILLVWNLFLINYSLICIILEFQICFTLRISRFYIKNSFIHINVISFLGYTFIRWIL